MSSTATTGGQGQRSCTHKMYIMLNYKELHAYNLVLKMVEFVLVCTCTCMRNKYTVPHMLHG